MKKKNKIFIASTYFLIVVIMILCVTMVIGGIKSYLKEEPNYNYVIDSVFEDGDILPVINTESNSIIRPYLSEKVKVGKYFYDYESDSKHQESALILYKNTYLQNKGVDYVSDEIFDVVSILDGEVINIEDNEIYGKVLTIKYNDNLKIIYSNIADVLVNIGYKTSQGEIIGVSEKSKFNNNEYMLHFEVYYKDKQIDPENLYTLSVSELE